MKVLVVGSGGREHAICWKISENKDVEKIYCAPGNGGISLLEKGENVNLKGTEELLDFAVKNKIDLTIVGSEELLVDGIVDKFKAAGLKIFGPDKKAAMLEGSKAFAKDFMKKYGIKTATYEIFKDPLKAKEYIKKSDFPLVVKASGLAAGKGVLICKNLEEALKAVDEIMVDKVFNDAGQEIVVEEFLDGVEASILSVTDSNVILPFISAKDHKKIGEKETGLNTGGMGTIAPNPYVTKDVYDTFLKDILNPTLKGIKEEKMDFAGFIFFGLMITEKGVYLLEYNMRLGDPETQVVLPLLESDFIEILQKGLEKKLDTLDVKWSDKSACCVVLASGGYPKKYAKGYEITGLDKVDGMTFVAGAKSEDGKLLTNGGRVLNVVALGKNLDEARKKAYADADKIDFKDKYMRRDIGILYR
ncbi:Phosphoribosylamine--glycine ligase [Fusobacterium sp. DD29]|uniref:phosphoribosylamine--glycine ligase n=1 Tax=unclassified Fusobacterium TaxID=2648384 RepID=UPI001B8B328C|nr:MULTISPECIES: phosphoribosylamine--glycine ligase [unclassified Fusobacterium]MBR8700913.1 Phosphoribosylamine--glycine ligase [Fusobacterium sp. DD45]MBR8710693.1 Phosphoribosylamine--glycine ligase [Fusobacterium sp. DD28]MBR8749168.1 Phosphoribosylamine--glycine ligase [Fusobacterium sp. DD29]MBR8751259.1 Phosphoribosylamine--glycine ligase [Fusobacterium sp. DD26]MBR8761434.1 Phosphoribosylamine--glycine ligase [Fusobacterium sp. DD25]